MISPGFYSLPATLALNDPATDSATTWALDQGAAGADAAAVISGGHRLTRADLAWSPTAGCWEASLGGAAAPAVSSLLYLDDTPLPPVHTPRLRRLGGDPFSLVFAEGDIPLGWDLSPASLRFWRIVINYSWTVGHHTVRAVFRHNNTVVFDQPATASGGSFYYIQNVPELFPTTPNPQPVAAHAAVDSQDRDFSGGWVNNDSAWGPNPVGCTQTGTALYCWPGKPAQAHWATATGVVRNRSTIEMWFEPNPQNVRVGVVAADNATITFQRLAWDPPHYTQVFTRSSYVPPRPSPPAPAPAGRRPHCTQTTPSDIDCTMAVLPWRLRAAASGRAATAAVLQIAGNESVNPIGPDSALYIPVLSGPLISIAGTGNGSVVANVTVANLTFGHTTDPCPSQISPGSDGTWSRAWDNPKVDPHVPRGSINNPACDCLMIVGGILSGARSALSALYTDRLVLDGLTVTGVGGSAVSVALSTSPTVRATTARAVGSNGFEFARTSGVMLADSRVLRYGLVMSGAAGVELDAAPNSVVEHNEFTGGVQNGGINLDCHGACAPTRIRKNHLYNLGTLNQFGLSDGGAIHIDASTEFVEVVDNLVHDIRAQTGNGGGLYIDDTSTNIYAVGNLMYNLKGGAIQWNKQAPGGIVNISNNIWVKSNNGSYAPVNADAFFNWNRDGAVSMQRNVVYYDSDTDGPLWPRTDGGKEFSNAFLDCNVYFDVARSVADFGAGPNWPDGTNWSGWQRGGHDRHSVIADPMFVSPRHHNFNFSTESPAHRLGIQPLNVSDSGPRLQA